MSDKDPNMIRPQFVIGVGKESSYGDTIPLLFVSGEEAVEETLNFNGFDIEDSEAEEKRVVERINSYIKSGEWSKPALLFDDDVCIIGFTAWAESCAFEFIEDDDGDHAERYGYTRPDNWPSYAYWEVMRLAARKILGE